MRGKLGMASQTHKRDILRRVSRVHPEVVGGFVWVAAGCQPAVQQTDSLRYVVAPIVNRL